MLLPARVLELGALCYLGEEGKKRRRKIARFKKRRGNLRK
jgi:hypothetical protein